MSYKVLKNPARALEEGAQIGCAAVSKRLKAALSTVLDAIKFILVERSCILEKAYRCKPKNNLICK